MVRREVLAHYNSFLCVAAASGGSPARGARLPHGGAGGLPGGPLRADARRVARRAGPATLLRVRQAEAGRHKGRHAAAAADTRHHVTGLTLELSLHLGSNVDTRHYDIGLTLECCRELLYLHPVR